MPSNSMINPYNLNHKIHCTIIIKVEILLYELGVVLLDLDRYEEAILMYENAIRYDI